MNLKNVLVLYHTKMFSASNEFRDKRKIRSLVFCQSQTSILLGASQSPAAAGASRHGKDLAIYLHHSCVGAPGSPTQSPRGAVRHAKPGPSRAHLPNAIRVCCPRVGTSHGARRHQAGTTTALGWTCTPELHLPEAWSQHGAGSWAWAGVCLNLKGIFSNTSLFKLLLNKLQGSGEEWGCRRSSQRNCQHLGPSLARRFKISF